MNLYTRNEKIVPVYIEDEMRSSYLDYAMSVIVARALPDVRDGLKPVHRRILIAMNDLNLSHGKHYRKCAKIAGDVSGNYHPHGEQIVYPSIVRMAQSFSLRYPLVDGQGNFGSIDGDPPAAMRYTEARLAAISGEMLKDINKDTVNFKPNYDETRKEPRVLPAAIPNLLINGASGIAVGMATEIPPHNLGEVIEGLVLMIDNPEVSIEGLMKIIKAPDFPTGGLIMGRGGIDSAHREGRGILKLRARSFVEKIQKADRERIVITEIPYQVNKSNLVESIASLVRDKKVSGISDLRDESDKDGMRIVIELRRGEIPEIILNQLYSHTQMQTSFGVIMLSLVKGRPKVLNLKEMLGYYLSHRREIVTRRTKFELARAEARAHILEGLRIALDNLDEVIKTIKASKTVDDARNALVRKFKLTEIQAQAILDMRLQRLTGFEREKLQTEYLELIKEIGCLQQILASEKLLMDIIKKELLEIKSKYADKRRTDVVEDTGEFVAEDLIAEEDMVITISHTGYIKRLPVSTYRKQKRGGKGVAGAGKKEEDFIEHLFIASTHAYILFFTDLGRVYWAKVYEIPQAGRLSRGKAIPNLLGIKPEEKMTAHVIVPCFDDEHFLLMITERGVVKRTNLSAYSHPRKDGIVALTLDENYKMIEVKLTAGSEEVFIATRNGKAIRFPEAQVRSVGRVSRGVKGINLGKGDLVIGSAISEKDATVLSVTEKGIGKRSRFEDYRLQKRGGQGVINIKITEKNGLIVGLRMITDRDELMLITSRGMVIRIPVEPIRILGRNTQGVRLIKLDEGDRVGAVARVATTKEEEQE
jgi:DNA gyrase subunit A